MLTHQTKKNKEVYDVIHHHLNKYTRWDAGAWSANQEELSEASHALDELFRSEGKKQPLTHIFDKCTLLPSHARARSRTRRSLGSLEWV